MFRTLQIIKCCFKQFGLPQFQGNIPLQLLRLQLAIVTLISLSILYNVIEEEERGAGHNIIVFLNTYISHIIYIEEEIG